MKTFTDSNIDSSNLIMSSVQPYQRLDFFSWTNITETADGVMKVFNCLKILYTVDADNIFPKLQQHTLPYEGAVDLFMKDVSIPIPAIAFSRLKVSTNWICMILLDE